MFACLYALAPITPPALVTIAQDFTPRFEVVGSLVLLDLSGLSRLFGTPHEIGDQLRRACNRVGRGRVRSAIAPTQTAAALLALGRPGLTVVSNGEHHAALAPLAITVLGEFERLRLAPVATAPVALSRTQSYPVAPPSVGEMEDVLPYFHSSLGRTSDAAARPHLVAGAAHLDVAGPHLVAGAAHLEVAVAQVPSCGGWSHPRDAHVAANTSPKRPAATKAGRPAAPPRALAIDDLLATLRRWGVKTFRHLAALPPGEVYERLGAHGIIWQRMARGEDLRPLVPYVPEDSFDASLDLEWPIEGLEPLSFVLARLLEPLSDRLERADRGAAVVHTHLRLVDKTRHARTVQLPAPMRDAKTLRTLVLLDLESNPPSAAIDCVGMFIEPTPARVTQWALFERAQPSPEHVSTLLARLTALMGASHVGSPQLVDSWKPGVFAMTPFQVQAVQEVQKGQEVQRVQEMQHPQQASMPSPTAPLAAVAPGGPHSALRRFRLPVPARVHVQDGRPVRILTDRRGVTGGAIVQSAGPWRTSGEWWNDGASGRSWDRDEWDVAVADGTVYRLYVERHIGQWFLEGIMD